jgi:hypothetical protein
VVTEVSREERRGAGRIRYRATAWLAWSIWLFSALFAATALVIVVLGVSAGVSLHELASGTINSVAIAVSFSTVGAVVASRRPKNPIGWIMCAGALGVALGSLTNAYAVYALYRSPEGPMTGAALSTWVSLLTTTVGVQSFSLLVLLFPDGKLPSNRWWPVVWLIIFVALAESAFWAFLAERFVGYGDISNPFHVDALDPLRDAYASYVQAPLSILAVLLPTIALVGRLWRSRGVERQQLKWVVTSGVLVALGVVLITFVLIFLGEESSRSQILQTVFFSFTTLAL